MFLVFLHSFAAEPIRIAKSSLVAVELILSGFAAKRIANLTLLLWICAREPGPAPQESALPLTKAEVSQL